MAMSSSPTLTAAAGITARDQRTLHRWVAAHHHPVIEVAAHITSPLSGALVIFGVQKAWQVPAMRAHFRSLSILWRHAGQGRVVAAGLQSVAPPMVQPQVLVTAAGPIRTFSTMAKVASPMSALGRHAGASPIVGGTRLMPHTRSRPAAAGILGWRGAARHFSDYMPPSTFASATAVMGSEGAQSVAGAVATAAAVPVSTSGQLDAAVALRLHKLLQLYSPDDVNHVSQHIADMWSVQQMEWLLHRFHDVAHLPWWAAIVSVTLGLRLLLVPFNVHLLRNTLRMKVITPEVQRLNALMETGTEEQRAQAALDLQALFKQRDCHPLRNFVIPLGFPPFILSVFGAIHNLTVAEPGMAAEGALWFKDLVAPDPTSMLPILSALTWLWLVECSSGQHYHAWANVRTTSRVVALAFIPLTATLPAGIFVFWITSNLFAITRSYVTRLDSVRRWLRIPSVSEINKLEHLPRRQG